jgi:hypothetical protein
MTRLRLEWNKSSVNRMGALTWLASACCPDRVQDPFEIHVFSLLGLV